MTAINRNNDNGYRRTQMQKEAVIQKLRDSGCRITRQRLVLLDIILEEDCSCCKEIYFKAVKQDPKIGTATVYRMINTLEEIGAISRKNMYKVTAGGREMGDQNGQTCVVEFEDGTSCKLSAQKWQNVLIAGLESCGYNASRKIHAVSIIQ